MLCDMCGSSGKLYKVIVEEAELVACEKCSKFGKVIGAVKDVKAEQRKKSILRKDLEPQTEVMELLIEDYSEKIRKRREGLGLTQEQFAKKINEKESLIQKIESKNFELPISLAKKIERFLNIKLIEEYEEKHEKQKKTKTETFTLGDFIKIK